jgi:hypothetical protein
MKNQRTASEETEDQLEEPRKRLKKNLETAENNLKNTRDRLKTKECLKSSQQTRICAKVLIS